MEINSLQSPFLIQNQSEVHKTKMTPGQAHESFKSTLSKAINNVNDLQNASSQKTERLAKGEINDLHDVMITGQKASITLQATLEVRNKVVEAYQEIMRMQV